jgi:hypothetical protein
MSGELKQIASEPPGFSRGEVQCRGRRQAAGVHSVGARPIKTLTLPARYRQMEPWPKAN